MTEALPASQVPGEPSGPSPDRQARRVWNKGQELCPVALSCPGPAWNPSCRVHAPALRFILLPTPGLAGSCPGGSPAGTSCWQGQGDRAP